MPQNYPQHREKATENSAILSNVKKSRQYDRFGEYVRYFTIDEFRLFTDVIDRQEHKLMMFLIPLSGTGCRVGEFVQIRLKHLDFLNSAVFFPAANTKTKHQRSSHIPRGLMNDIVMYLRGQNRMAKRTYRVFDGEDFLFRSHHRKRVPYTTNRIRQIFLHYVRKAGLDREYGADVLGRRLHKFTIHTLRHSHCMHYIHIYKLPVPIVQRQVGHTTLDATMTYCRPTDEFVGESFRQARIIPIPNPAVTA